MKPHQKLITYLSLSALAVICFFLFRSPWHIITTILLAFCMYLIYELNRAPVMPDDYDD